MAESFLDDHPQVDDRDVGTCPSAVVERGLGHVISGQQIADLWSRCNDGDTGTAEFRSVVAPLLPVPVGQWEWPYT